MISGSREVRSERREVRKSLILFLLIITAGLFLSPVYAHERRSAVVETVEKTGPAVVNIRTEQIVQRRTSPFFGFGDSFFDDFFSQFAPTRKYRTQALGSGALIDPKGILLTNAHVVAKASKIYVALPGDIKEREATLVGIDHQTDLAVIKVDAGKPLPSLSLSDDENLFLGETVIAIGNPLGLENSVTTGVVSAPRRRLPDGSGGVSVFIQTDALINPGNSGGPLLDINGNLIGINTAIAQQAQGIGFAVPIKVVKRVKDELIRFGRVRSAYTGILPGEISRSMVRARGAGGVLVTDVDDGSPAARAGVQIADVILGVEGVQVDMASEYLSLLRSYPPDSDLVLKLLRGEEELQAIIRLSELPENYALNYFKDIFGLIVEEERQGIVVSKILPDSHAARIELKPGDIIAEVEGKRVASMEAFTERIEETLGQLPLKLAIYRGNRAYLVELP